MLVPEDANVRMQAIAAQHLNARDRPCDPAGGDDHLDG
jgi:hypothetical protein